MDAIELLKHDHRRVEQLFRDYRAAASGAQRRGVVELLVRELSRHAALEEQMFYPLARKALPEDQEEIDRHLDAHMAVKKTLLALDRQSSADEHTDALVAALEREVRAHVREEENDLMPRLREHVSQQNLDELGRLLDRAGKAAPTRPHPHAPDRPPALSLAAPVAAAYDRLRDRLQGRANT